MELEEELLLLDPPMEKVTSGTSAPAGGARAGVGLELVGEVLLGAPVDVASGMSALARLDLCLATLSKEFSRPGPALALGLALALDFPVTAFFLLAVAEMTT